MKSDLENIVAPGELSVICSSDKLLSGGFGVRFTVKDATEKVWPAFAVRYLKEVSGFLNRCSHLMLELDWEAGQFFDIDGEHLICSTHGALYQPQSGDCIGGPCNGVGLESLGLKEERGNIYLDDLVYQLHSVDGAEGGA